MVGAVVPTNSVVPLSVCFLVVCTASVLLVGVLWVTVVVMRQRWAVVIPEVPVLVSIGMVAAFVGITIPVEGPWVWLGDTWRVGCAAEVSRARVEAVVEGVVYGMVASVGGSGVELVAVLLNLGDEVAGGEGVMVWVVVVVVVGVEAVALKVSSSVMCDPSVTVTGVVVRKSSVTSTGVSVRELSTPDVLLLTVGDAVVRPKLTLWSLVWDETPSVPS